MKQLKYIRKASGFNQKELADLVGISQSYMCELEKNKKTPSVKVLKDISNALGVSVMRLFN